jgi:hypothetical protein
LTPAHDLFEICNRKAREKHWETRADPTLAFREPRLLEFRQVWNHLADGHRLPSRAELTARLMKPYLRNLTVMDIGQPAEKRFVHRFVGSEIAYHMGELTGIALEELLPPHLLRRTTLFLEAVIEARCAVRIVTHFQLKAVDFLFAEIFAAPLASDGMTADKLFSLSYFPSEFGELREELARL